MNQSIRNGINRLRDLKAENEVAGEAMAEDAKRFKRIAGEEPTRAITAFNLFQTPEAIADMMAARLAGLVPLDGRILEPSAGLGRLCRAARLAGLSGPMVWVESSPQCAAELYGQSQGSKLIQDDFLACDLNRLGGAFDGVLMNPPFKMGTDIKHIKHAHAMLKAGGWLVALCYNGTKQNAKLRPLVDSWEVLPAGSFKSEGTSAEVVLLTWRAND